MSVDLLECLLEGLQQQSLLIINISNITSAWFNSSQPLSSRERKIEKVLKRAGCDSNNYTDSS
jgi:hypothetical protein